MFEYGRAAMVVFAFFCLMGATTCPSSAQTNRTKDVAEKEQLPTPWHLRSIILENTNSPAGTRAFENLAARAGIEPEAAYVLGEMYSKGEGVERSVIFAVRYYRMAAEGGHPRSKLKVGRLLAETGRTSEELEQAQHWLRGAVELRVAGAEVALARTLLRDASREQVQEAITILERASEAHDSWATRHLIRLYSEGKLVPADMGKARRLFDVIQPRLDEQAANFESLILRSAEIQTKGNFSELRTLYQALSPRFKRLSINRVYSVNPNAYVYLLQVELGDRGFLNGTPDGILGRATIAAMMDACAALDILADCRRGPLTWNARSSLAASFAESG